MSDEEYLKLMADLLKSGATMLQDTCPECGSPLFRISGEIWCPRHNKRVIRAKKGEKPIIPVSSSLGDVERIIIKKIQENIKLINEEKNAANLEKLSSQLVKWLEALERIRRIQKF